MNISTKSTVSIDSGAPSASADKLESDERGGKGKDALETRLELQRLFQKIYVRFASRSRRSSSEARSSEAEGGYSGARSTHPASRTSRREEEDEGPHLLANFMLLAGERITWIEAYELWHDMRSTNNSKLPSLNDTMHSSMRSIGASRSRHRLTADSDSDSEVESDAHADVDAEIPEVWKTFLTSADTGEADADQIKAIIETLAIDDFTNIARSIKSTYSIRLSDDKAELKFITFTLLTLWSILCILITCGIFFPENDQLGSLTYAVIIEAVILFVGELLWECILSAVVLRFNIKINYTRKLGNLFKIPKYFVADLLPFYRSTATSLMTALTVNQTLFCSMYYRKSRERVSFFSYVFLSQDRREDRPDTLIFQVTEDLLRFLIYIPFKLFVANRFSVPEIIFIPIAVNNIGDGLAEPVGVAFGKHKYTTTALYHKGKFFKSKFTRSYEGSSCVFITTLIVVTANYKSFNTTQFWVTFSVLPFLMTIAEAKAPHTNDGPFLALIGCSFLTLVLLYL